MASYSTIERFIYRSIRIQCRFGASVFLLITVISLSVIPSFGQKSDSLFLNLKKVENININKLDSLPSLNEDSLQLKLKLDSISSRLNNSIDSLSTLKLPTERYYGKLDSLLKSTQAGLNSKIKSGTDSLSSRSNALINKYQAKLESRKQRLDSLNTKYKLGFDLKQPDAGIDFNPGEFKMAEVGSPEFNQPNVPGFNLPATNLPKVDIPGVENVTEKLDQVNEIPGEVQKYSDKVEGLKNIDVKEEAKKLPGEIEKQAENLDQVQALKKELPQTGTVTDQVDDIKSMADPTSVKEEVKKRTRKAFVDHFAGKQEAVKSGITQLEKYQKKYNSVADIRYLPKKRPNTMKGKPLVERLAPGVMLQVFAMESDWKGIDISPSIEYWFSDRFRAGLGGSYRINLNTKSFEIEDRDHIYSFRSLANYKLGKGFFAHLEVEALRTKEYLVKKPPQQPTDYNTRAWDYSVNTGIFKSYHISKSVRGTLVVLYDLTQIDETFNVSQIAMRFGLEFKIHQKKTDPARGTTPTSPK